MRRQRTETHRERIALVLFHYKLKPLQWGTLDVLNVCHTATAALRAGKDGLSAEADWFGAFSHPQLGADLCRRQGSYPQLFHQVIRRLRERRAPPLSFATPRAL